jgi:N4-gp56 family major capsid protein
MADIAGLSGVPLSSGFTRKDIVHGGPILTGSGSATIPDGASGALAAGSGAGNEIVRATFDKLIQWKLRWEPMYRNFATRRPVNVAFPGSKVTMFRAGATDLVLATTPLSEYEDPDAVALPGVESCDLTMDEYGAATVTTLRLRKQAWTQIDPLQAEYVARNLRDTVDAIYMNAIYSATGGFANTGFLAYKGDAAGAISVTAAAAAGAQSLSAGHIRRIVAKFRNLGVTPMADGFFLGLITPDVSVALRETTDVAGWRYPHLEANANENIFRGTVGVFEGVRFIESPQFKGMDKGDVVNPAIALVSQSPTDATAANLLFIGNEGLVEGVVQEPGVTTTPQTDKFGRLLGLGWIGWFGASVYDGNAGMLFDVKNG